MSEPELEVSESTEEPFHIKTPLTKYLLGIPVEEIEKSMVENPHMSALNIAIQKSMTEKPHMSALSIAIATAGSEPEPEDDDAEPSRAVANEI
uniref:Uncharacterized protein n=1 Tax=viral metagenome TaxID=1070528 RepID=A0A6C0KFN2_9ZZZZ